MAQSIHVIEAGIQCTFMDEHGTPSINPKMVADSTIDIQHRCYIGSLTQLDDQFARLLEQYVNDLKGAQCLQNYPPIEYERYIEELLTILREYRLRVPTNTRHM